MKATILTKKAYSINEACDTLSLGRTYLYSLIRTGKIKAKKEGKRTIITSSSLDNYLSSLPDYLEGVA